MKATISALSLIRDDELLKEGCDPFKIREKYYLDIKNKNEIVEHIDQIDTLELDEIEKLKVLFPKHYLICVKNLNNDNPFYKLSRDSSHLFVAFYLTEKNILHWQLFQYQLNDENEIVLKISHEKYSLDYILGIFPKLVEKAIIFCGYDALINSLR